MIRAEWIPSWTKFSVASYLLGTQRPWNVAGAPVPAPWQVPSERKPMDITGLQKITQQEICCQSCFMLIPFVASFHSCEIFYAVIAQPWAIPKLSTCPPYTHHCLVQKPSCLPDVYVPCWTMTAPKSKPLVDWWGGNLKEWQTTLEILGNIYICIYNIICCSPEYRK
jgi:hypothetical protein